MSIMAKIVFEYRWATITKDGMVKHHVEIKSGNVDYKVFPDNAITRVVTEYKQKAINEPL